MVIYRLDTKSLFAKKDLKLTGSTGIRMGTCMTSQGHALFDKSGICHFHAKNGRKIRLRGIK